MLVIGMHKHSVAHVAVTLLISASWPGARGEQIAFSSLIPSSSNWTRLAPALQGLLVLFYLAQELKKAPRKATSCCRASGMARHQKGPGLSAG